MQIYHLFQLKHAMHVHKNYLCYIILMPNHMLRTHYLINTLIVIYHQRMANDLDFFANTKLQEKKIIKHFYKNMM